MTNCCRKEKTLPALENNIDQRMNEERNSQIGQPNNRILRQSDERGPLLDQPNNNNSSFNNGNDRTFIVDAEPELSTALSRVRACSNFLSP